ncbi:hypothetical protein C8R44DRAFT_771925 [Mycena epipterygia]|nr:hypothetical protein C8R44DRAFT_771925 [Mycena epipterygia]
MIMGYGVVSSSPLRGIGGQIRRNREQFQHRVGQLNAVSKIWIHHGADQAVSGGETASICLRLRVL